MLQLNSGFSQLESFMVGYSSSMWRPVPTSDVWCRRRQQQCMDSSHLAAICRQALQKVAMCM